MKRALIGALVSGLVFSGVALAEGGAACGGMGKKGQKFERMLGRMQQQLDLSDEQADKLYELFQEGRKNSNCKELKKFSERRKCRESGKESFKAAAKQVLSEEQFAKFEAMKEKRKERWKNRRNEGERGAQGQL